MNASEKNKNRNKNYKTRPKENEGGNRKEKEERRELGGMESTTAFHKDGDTGLGLERETGRERAPEAEPALGSRGHPHPLPRRLANADGARERCPPRTGTSWC